MKYRTRKLLWLTTIFTLLLSFDVSAQLPAPAPWVTKYPGTDNLKNYSSIPIWISGVPNPPMGGTLMAGTYFGSPGATGNPNATHFVRVDNQGVVQVWEYLQETGTNCMDERAITVSSDPNNYDEIYLTSLVRFDDNGFFSDRIKIYVVDFNGNIVRENIIQSTDHFWENLYPTHSLLSPGLDGGTLYICGYVMEANSLRLPGQGPTYLLTGSAKRTNKAAFVMSINTATLTMTHFKIFDYTYPALPPGTGTFPDPATLGQVPGGGLPPSSDYQPALPPIGVGNDFDIATRLNIIDNARIHVTGSITAMNFGIYIPPSGASWAPFARSEYVSGVMNLTLDPNDLSTKDDKPFRIEDGSDPLYSMGMDIKEGFAPPRGYYIMANHFTPEIIVGSPSHPDLSGYAPIPHHMFATYCESVPQGLNTWGNPTNYVPIPMYNTEPDEYVNAGFTIGGTVPLPSSISYGHPRMQDEEWGINSVTGPSWITQSNPPHCDMWIGGYRKHPTMWHEYEPTLTRLQLGYDPVMGIINVAPPVQMYYSSMTGTGPGSASNNFPNLGNGLSNMLWAPPMTTAIDNWDVMMGVPRWNGVNSLNLKYIHVDRNTGTLIPSSGPNMGTDYCPNSYGTFSNTEYTYKVLPPHGIDMDLSVVTTDGTATDIQPISTITAYQQSDDACFTTGMYKTTGIGKLNTGNKTTIYPNPATTELYISLSDNIAHDANVQVHLLNLVGQSVGLLYRGSAGNINGKALQLQDMAPGMYMVQVMSNNKIVHREKLVIK